MKILYNNIIPFPGYLAINLFGILFVRKDAAQRKSVSEFVINHETIHSKQMKEMLWIPFYIWYGIEWFIKLFNYNFDSHTAYRNISFEREAYENENDLSYKYHRKRYNWLKLLKRTKK